MVKNIMRIYPTLADLRLCSIVTCQFTLKYVGNHIEKAIAQFSNFLAREAIRLGLFGDFVGYRVIKGGLA